MKEEAFRSSSVWSRGRLEALDGCPACGSVFGMEEAEYRRRDDELKMPDVWAMHRCTHCGSIYLNPRPDEASLPLAYSDYYTHAVEMQELASFKTSLINGYLNFRFGMSRKPATLLGAILFFPVAPLRLSLNHYGRHLEKLRPGEVRSLLDIGCGNGEFLKIAREMGWRTRGCEPDKNAVSVCRERELDVIHGDAFHPGLDGEAFDSITMNHVIEHVRDPAALLNRVFQLLVPGGRLWMALPNPGAAGLSIFKQGWKGLHPPFHLTIPSQKILAKWLESAGFEKTRLLRRGMQSRGLWRDSREIARREGVPVASMTVKSSRLFMDIVSTFSSRWSEETVIVARKPRSSGA